MSRRSHDPQQPLTAAQVEQWITATSSMRLHLHILATAPWHSVERHAAFTQMSELLQDAIEEVRLISASLREGSQCLRDRSTELCEHSARLLKRSTRVTEHIDLFVLSQQEIHDAERQRKMA